MIIQRKKIRNVEKYFGHFQKGDRFSMGITDPDNFSNRIKRIGFSYPLIIGEKTLPSGSFGRISNFNANGKYLVKRNKPKETVYYQREWTREEWAGYRQTRTVTDTVDIPYERYPREFVLPPSVELIVQAKEGKTFIIAETLTKGVTEESQIKHIANLFLEIFGEFAILDENFIPTKLPEIKRLNWEVLPKGEMPWEKAKQFTDKILNQTKSTKRPVVEKRLEYVNSFGAEFMALGRAGFRGYIIYGFPRINKFILESAYHGNATYIFNKSWEALSQMTKAEILNNDLQEDRVIHSKGWEEKIKKVLN